MGNIYQQIRVAKATFDPSANAAQKVQDTTYGLGVFIPDNAIITEALIDVVTGFASDNSDTATIAIQANSADDLVAAIAIDQGTIWDGGLHGTLAGTPILNTNAADGDTAIKLAALVADKYIKTTATIEIKVVLGASQDLTAGKMHIYIKYFVSE